MTLDVAVPCGLCFTRYGSHVTSLLWISKPVDANPFSTSI